MVGYDIGFFVVSGGCMSDFLFDNSEGDGIPQSDRLQILSPEEYELLLGFPRFTQSDRDLFFTLTAPEREALGGLIDAEDARSLDRLLADDEGLHQITTIKRQPRDFTYQQLLREIERGQQLRSLFALAERAISQVALSAESVRYYASLVEFYTVYKLNRMVREKKLMPLMTAISKMTYLPAQFLEENGVAQVAFKGRIQLGADADISIFDPETVKDNSIPQQAGLLSTGIPYVIVKGTLTCRYCGAEMKIIAFVIEFHPNELPVCLLAAFFMLVTRLLALSGLYVSILPKLRSQTSWSSIGARTPASLSRSREIL